MNDTKWIEIFKAFYYGIECSDDPVLANMEILWETKSVGGYIYSDTTWTHFGVGIEKNKDIEWLKIYLTPQNKKTVLDILRKIHVPGEVTEHEAIVYGYRTDVDYIV